MTISQQRKNEINNNYYYRNKEKILQKHKEQYTNPEVKQKKHEQYEKWKAKNPEQYMLSRIQSSAKIRGIECNITLDDIKIPAICPLLGTPFILGTKTSKDYTPSMDRIDTSKGYTKENIWIISYKANRMKTDASKEELISFAKGILKLTQNS